MDCAGALPTGGLAYLPATKIKNRRGVFMSETVSELRNIALVGVFEGGSSGRRSKSQCGIA